MINLINNNNFYFINGGRLLAKFGGTGRFVRLAGTGGKLGGKFGRLGGTVGGKPVAPNGGRPGGNGKPGIGGGKVPGIPGNGIIGLGPILPALNAAAVNRMKKNLISIKILKLI